MSIPYFIHRQVCHHSSGSIYWFIWLCNNTFSLQRLHTCKGGGQFCFLHVPMHAMVAIKTCLHMAGWSKFVMYHSTKSPDPKPLLINNPLNKLLHVDCCVGWWGRLLRVPSKHQCNQKKHNSFSFGWEVSSIGELASSPTIRHDLHV